MVIKEQNISTNKYEKLSKVIKNRDYFFYKITMFIKCYHQIKYNYKIKQKQIKQSQN